MYLNITPFLGFVWKEVYFVAEMCYRMNRRESLRDKILIYVPNIYRNESIVFQRNWGREWKKGNSQSL